MMSSAVAREGKGERVDEGVRGISQRVCHSLSLPLRSSPYLRMCSQGNCSRRSFKGHAPMSAAGSCISRSIIFAALSCEGGHEAVKGRAGGACDRARGHDEFVREVVVMTCINSDVQ